MLILQCNFNGVTRIFQRGGGGRGSHKVNHRVLTKFLSQPPRYVLLNVKKKLTKKGRGVTGTPEPPPPATPLNLEETLHDVLHQFERRS